MAGGGYLLRTATGRTILESGALPWIAGDLDIASGGGGSLSAPTVLLDADSSRTYGAGSYTTGSTTAPAAGSLLIAHVVYCTNGGGDPGVDITISDSGGHTWSEPVGQQRRQGSGTDWIGEAFFVADNSSTSGFTVTVDTSAGTIWAWQVQVLEVGGGSGATIGATGSVSNSGNGAVNFALSAAPAAGSYVIAGLGIYETNDVTLQVTEGGGWTEAVEAGRSVPNAQVQFRTGSTSDQVDWADNGTTVTGYLGLAFEIEAGGGGGTVSGDIVATLEALTASLAGSPVNTGTVAVTLAALTAAVTGSPVATGTIAATLEALTASLAGAPAVAGTIAATLEALTGAVIGTPVSSGQIASTLEALTGTLTGSPVDAGTIATTLAALTAAVTGSPIVTGSIDATLGDLTGLIVQDAAVSGVLDAALAALTGIIVGTPVATGTISATLGALTAALEAFPVIDTGPQPDPGGRIRRRLRRPRRLPHKVIRVGWEEYDAAIERARLEAEAAAALETVLPAKISVDDLAQLLVRVVHTSDDELILLLS